MVRLVRHLTLPAMLLILLAAGCGRSQKVPATTATLVSSATPATRLTLRLGYFPNITHATAIVGVSEGIFARALGANVTLQTATFNAGPEEVEALLSGALDAGYIGPNPALNAFIRSHGEAVRVISGATSGGAALVVRPEINGPADLRGKTLATPQLGNTQDVALRSWLKAQGLSTTTEGGGDVAIAPQQNADTLNAFKAGKIAGAWVPEPWATRLVLEGGGKVLVDERRLWPNGLFATTVLIVRTDFARAHPDVVRALLRGQIEANDFVNAQPERAQQIVNDAIARITGQRLNPQVLATAWNNLTFTNDPIASSLKKAATDAAALGFLKLDNLDVARIYDLQPLNALLRASGAPEVAQQ
jgi:NitT/TauT family transport system substrate-binding protein